jgi:hypothetical protein
MNWKGCGRKRSWHILTLQRPVVLYERSALVIGNPEFYHIVYVCMYVLRLNLRVNSDYFPTRH